MKTRSLPLGVDIGATRIRVVDSRNTPQGARVHAVAIRDITAGSCTSGAISEPEFVAALLEEAIAELRTRERRCVCSIGEPDAVLRSVTFPKMSAMERERSARFEAQRYVDYPVEDAVVRAHRVKAPAAQWLLGIARSAAMKTRLDAVRRAGLKVVAMDHEACALARALPEFDGALDIGYQRTSLHVFDRGAPRTFQAFSGGADITRGIERDLAIDTITAERRKRILGTAGAGERARAMLIADISKLLASAGDIYRIDRIALVGNGARLPGLASEIESANGILCEIAVSGALRSQAYPEDVVRSSAVDWTLAAALTTWGIA